jgi:hypothetical protein
VLKEPTNTATCVTLTYMGGFPDSDILLPVLMSRARERKRTLVISPPFLPSAEREEEIEL